MQVLIRWICWIHWSISRCWICGSVFRDRIQIRIRPETARIHQQDVSICIRNGSRLLEMHLDFCRPHTRGSHTIKLLMHCVCFYTIKLIMLKLFIHLTFKKTVKYLSNSILVSSFNTLRLWGQSFKIFEFASKICCEARTLSLSVCLSNVAS